MGSNHVYTSLFGGGDRSKILTCGVTGFTDITSKVLQLKLKLPLRTNPREYYDNYMWWIFVLHVPMAYRSTTRQNIPQGHPLLTLVEGVDGKVDFSVNMPGFR